MLTRSSSGAPAAMYSPTFAAVCSDDAARTAPCTDVSWSCCSRPRGPRALAGGRRCGRGSRRARPGSGSPRPCTRPRPRRARDCAISPSAASRATARGSARASPSTRRGLRDGARLLRVDAVVLAGAEADPGARLRERRSPPAARAARSRWARLREDLSLLDAAAQVDLQRPAGGRAPWSRPSRGRVPPMCR
jgi:hypothetical protein